MASCDRREFLSCVAAGVAASAVSGGAASMAAGQAATPTSASGATLPGTFSPPAFSPMPLGSIRPSGWLLRQLRIQADGLSGHLDEFWPDVGESQWFGGKAEGWERAPYWLDGVIPLAWILDDEPLKARITRYVDFIVTHQRADGWYGPYPEDAVAKRYDMWAILLANKVLVQYHEATGDARVLDAVVKSLRAMLAGLDRTPLYGWGRFRWYEGLVSVFYVYERTREPWLLELAMKLREQGVDFEALYKTDDITRATPRRGLWKWTKHVVNTGMAAKAAALNWRLDRRPSDKAFAKSMIELLDRHHGQVTGMFSGDECLAGRNPLQGTELCSVVEFMYSLEHLFSAFGDPFFADRLERVAFNALAGHVRAGHVVAPVRPAGEPGAVHGQPRTPVHDERPGVEPLRTGTELRVLHVQHAPGMAQVRRAPVDADAGRGAGGGRVRPEPRDLQVEGRARRRHARHGLSVPRTAGSHRRSRSRRVVPAAAPRARVGGGRDRPDRGPAGAAHGPGHAPPHRPRVEGQGGHRRAIPDEGDDHHALQRGRRGRARPARLRAEDRGDVDPRERRQASPGTAARRFRGAAGWRVELRSRHRRGTRGRGRAVRGAAGRRAAVLAGWRRHDCACVRAGRSRPGSSSTAGPARSRPPTWRGPTRREASPTSQTRR